MTDVKIRLKEAGKCRVGFRELVLVLVCRVFSEVRRLVLIPQQKSAVQQ